MKKLGIIGGAGPLASALLYESIVQEHYRREMAIPEIFLINYPFTRGLTLIEGKTNNRTIQEELVYCIDILIQNKIEVGVVACNTLHLYLHLLPANPISFISLPHLVMNEAEKRGHPRLLVLGTQNTCQSGLYERSGIFARYPSSEAQMRIDEVIDRVLEGKVYQADSQLIGQVILQQSQEMEFDGVVLGCTDLPVLHHHFPIPSCKPIYDSIKTPAKILGDLL